MFSVRKLIVIAAAVGALLVAAPAAAAQPGQQSSKPARPKPRPAPEFDPAAAGAIATLLAGAGVLLVRRRR
jgi:hypothetical protein